MGNSRLEKMTIAQLWEHITSYPDDHEARMLLVRSLHCEHCRELRLVHEQLQDRSLHIRDAFQMMLDFELEMAEAMLDSTYLAAREIFSIDKPEKNSVDNGSDPAV